MGGGSNSNDTYRRRCRFCGFFTHEDEVLKVPCYDPHPGSGHSTEWAWACLKCVEKINNGEIRIRAARPKDSTVIEYERKGR